MQRSDVLGGGEGLGGVAYIKGYCKGASVFDVRSCVAMLPAMKV